jgi:hypothetical protein
VGSASFHGGEDGGDEEDDGDDSGRPQGAKPDDPPPPVEEIPYQELFPDLDVSKPVRFVKMHPDLGIIQDENSGDGFSEYNAKDSLKRDCPKALAENLAEATSSTTEDPEKIRSHLGSPSSSKVTTSSEVGLKSVSNGIPSSSSSMSPTSLTEEARRQASNIPIVGAIGGLIGDTPPSTRFVKTQSETAASKSSDSAGNSKGSTPEEHQPPKDSTISNPISWIKTGLDAVFNALKAREEPEIPQAEAQNEG